MKDGRESEKNIDKKKTKNKNKKKTKGLCKL